jgi:hypothetical protein
VDACWDSAVAALKAALEPAFRGATAAAAMLTVKDFLLLVCLALGEPLGAAAADSFQSWRYASLCLACQPA